MFRPSRTTPSKGGDRFLLWKIRLFVIGAVLALAGMGWQMQWLVWVGILALIVGLVLRFLPARPET